MNNTIEFNKDKFKSVLHYIINKCGCKNNVGRTVIYKLLYFTDFNYFELYEKPLTCETYKKLPRGPAPSHFHESVEELIQESKISETKKPFLDGYKFDYVSLIEPDYNLTDDELNVIDNVISKLGNMNSKEISNYSHGDMPWRATDDYGIIDYGFVFYRDPDYSVRVYNESD